MPFGKSPEQKAREQAEEEERAARRLAAQAEGRAELEAKRFAESPVGLATAAKEAGQGFFEIQLKVEVSSRAVAFGTADFAAGGGRKSFAGTLSEIEAVGWKLEHVGYVFVVTGESSRDKLLSSGQATAVSGKTMGIYLFRNGDHPLGGG